MSVVRHGLYRRPRPCGHEGGGEGGGGPRLGASDAEDDRYDKYDEYSSGVGVMMDPHAYQHHLNDGKHIVCLTWM
jgi:hypothetical protein